MSDGESMTPATDARKEKLAAFLYELVYGEGTWSDADDNLIANYRGDADDVFLALPHLAPGWERDGLPSLD